MASSPDTVSMALFCDFENVALGVRDAQYEKFDIKPVLERLLLKGSIVVKKAYCDWDRYKGFKATMHEANFELIEIPHVRQSGKNSADIRLVVDALDLCYTKSHVNTFVIISGDSDFSPLVSKLRENAKQVIGVGVKQSTSDLLVANCDEFIFYDDLVRESRRATARRDPREAPPAPRRSPEEERQRREDIDKRRSKAVEMAAETFDALVAERGDSGKIWASVLKEAIKRRKPDFSESYYGFRSFGNLLEEAQARGLLEFGRDEKSGAYVYRSGNGSTPPVRAEAPTERPASRQGQPANPRVTASPGDSETGAPATERPAGSSYFRQEPAAAQDQTEAAAPATGRPSGSYFRQEAPAPAQEQSEATAPAIERPAGSYFRQEPAATAAPAEAPAEPAGHAARPAPASPVAEPRRRARGGRKPGAQTRTPHAQVDLLAMPEQPQAAVAPAPEPASAPVTATAPAPQATAPAAPAAPEAATPAATPADTPEAPAAVRKPAPRTRRPRKPAADTDQG
jgi:uncharacterized LabA/DUF88 family protein